MTTMKDVAELAGVSQATVSRVINSTGPVTDKTRTSVNAAMQSLNYRPNSIAQSLASNCTNSVGVLVSELTGPFYGPMMAGIEAELRKAHKHVIVAAGHSEEAEEIEAIEFLINRNCDALILHVEAVSDAYLIELCNGPTPIILLNRLIDEISEQCISLDNVQGGRLATEELIKYGHRHIACITGPLWKQDATGRLQGYKEALIRAGIKVNENIIIEGNFKEDGGIDAMKSILANDKSVTAVFCCNDEMAFGAISVLKDQGIKVPEEVSIIGFDDVSFSYYLSPKLSTVLNPMNTMGKIAADLILSSVYNKTQTNHERLLLPHIVSRDSVTTVST